MEWALASANNAMSAYERNRGMSKEQSAAHEMGSFVDGWRFRRAAHRDRFREDFELPLTAAAYVIFRVVSELSPMRELPGVIEAASEGSPDE